MNRAEDILGKNILKVLIMDFETSGLEHPVHIAEFCVMLARMDLRRHRLSFDATAGAFVIPRAFEPDALKVNGIDVEKLANTTSMKHFFGFLSEGLREADLLVGHNILYDLKALENEVSLYRDVSLVPSGFPKSTEDADCNIFCTCEDVKNTLGMEKFMNLNKTAKFFKINVENRDLLYKSILKKTEYDPSWIRREPASAFHNALFDVATTFSIFAKIIKDESETKIKFWKLVKERIKKPKVALKIEEE